ncbi:MAG: hypothetical protein Aurels2KO_48350 [Aureliella sp.]
MIRIAEKIQDYLTFWFAERAIGSVRIHPAFPLCVIFIGFLFPIASWIGLASPEMASVVTTLPLIWVASVAFRFAAQQLTLGEYACEVQFMIGPTGNQSIDYEFLPRSRLFGYAVAGQIAGLTLTCVGLLVVMATLGTSGTDWKLHHLLDFRGGWSNGAIGSQILWVNLFLLTLHSLPTVPFDMRAAVFGFVRRGEPMALEPRALRCMSAIDTHLAAVFLGIGVACLGFGIISGATTGWYAFIGAAIYMFVAGRWEGSRAVEAEQQYTPMPARELSLQRHQPMSREPIARGPHFEISRQPTESELTEDSMPVDEIEDRDQALESLVSDTSDMAENEQVDPQDESLDVDEILRKLHREGAESLSEREQEHLLMASRELNARRQTL